MITRLPAFYFAFVFGIVQSTLTLIIRNMNDTPQWTQAKRNNREKQSKFNVFLMGFDDFIVYKIFYSGGEIWVTALPVLFCW